MKANLLTIDELAQYLNVKKSKIRFFVFHKKIPVVRLGRNLRFDLNDIEKWLEQQKQNMRDN